MRGWERGSILDCVLLHAPSTSYPHPACGCNHSHIYYLASSMVPWKRMPVPSPASRPGWSTTLMWWWRGSSLAPSPCTYVCCWLLVDPYAGLIAPRRPPATAAPGWTRSGSWWRSTSQAQHGRWNARMNRSSATRPVLKVGLYPWSFFACCFGSTGAGLHEGLVD